MKRRLVYWGLFVFAFAAIAYASQFAGGKPPKDVAYRWESSVSGLIEYALVFGLVMLFTRGLDRREFLAFRRPAISWWRVLGLSVLIVIAVFVVSAAVAPFGNPEKEQGLIPTHWNSHKIAQFAAYAAVVTIVGPVVEELMFRGVGFAVLEPYGRAVAIVGVGLAFALVHGLLAGFPIIATFGLGLAYLRARAGSIYPCILLHASFNALGLALGVAT
jgi:membrane protease YdiL (CAAX protease family)